MYAVLYTVHAMCAAPATTGRLSRERILAAAGDLVARDGIDGLSMRRLAQELDVWPMGLYRYFHDKEELVAALADTAAAGVSAPAGGSWRDQIGDLLGQVRVLWLRHPGGLANERLREIGVGILTGAGVDDAERAWRALLAFAAGASALELGAAEFDFGLARMLDALEVRDNARP